jgi:Cu(I)/Ag(I) efflux system membrane fusion protein
MFVNVELQVALGQRLAVPESAVLPTGERRMVFVDLGNGRLAPRDVQLGARAGDYIEVLSGLKPGDVVVTSGNFLVAAESKLKSATQKW